MGVVGSFVEHLINRTVTKPRSISAVWIFLAVLCALQPAFAYQLAGKVTAVVDGDTVIIDGGGAPQKIRVQGIDAPESAKPFGAASTRNLSALALGKPVTVEAQKTDQYGRIVGKMLLPDGRDAGLLQVAAGLAWHYRQYEAEQTPTDRKSYAAAEDQARNMKLGLWRAARPQPPWDFRHGTNSELTYENGHRKGGEPEAGMMILGNRRTGIYHWPGCPYFDKISPSNRVTFHNREAAEKAGYRAARNCP